MQPESIKAFKRLYVTAEKAVREIEKLYNAGQSNEQLLEQAIAYCNEMISLMPIQFTTQEGLSRNDRMLLVNINDPEDEPQQFTPNSTHQLYEDTIHTVLENWKFIAWNMSIYATQDAGLKEKYTALMLAQAHLCMQRFPHGSHWLDWEKDMFVLYANQIGWFAFEQEADVQKLGAALAELDKGFQVSNWSNLKYIKDSKVRLLLKLNRPLEAYPIVQEALARDGNFVDFQDLKNDQAFLAWQAVQQDVAQKAKEAFLERIKTEQENVSNQFIHPQHPLVIQHTAALNLIKQRMVSLKLRKMYKDDFVTVKENWDEEKFALETWSVEKVAQFEKDNQIRLPDELKVYLMEIGEGGKRYFCYGGIKMSFLTDNPEDLENARKPFPITEDKMHDICQWYGVNAWVYPDDEEWKEVGILDESDDMEAMFGLPEDAEMTDGCFGFGDANSQDPLLLVMNGVFEGEVWADTLQYGAEAGGCFAPAAGDRPKLLAFIADSVLAHEEWYPDARKQGYWM